MSSHRSSETNGGYKNSPSPYQPPTTLYKARRARIAPSMSSDASDDSLASGLETLQYHIDAQEQIECLG